MSIFKKSEQTRIPDAEPPVNKPAEPAQKSAKNRQVKAVAAVLAHVADGKYINRKEVAELTGYSGKSVARFCGALIAAKLLRQLRSNDPKDVEIRYVSGAHKVFQL